MPFSKWSQEVPVVIIDFILIHPYLLLVKPIHSQYSIYCFAHVLQTQVPLDLPVMQLSIRRYLFLRTDCDVAMIFLFDVCTKAFKVFKGPSTFLTALQVLGLFNDLLFLIW